jgi:hypothetical protein
MTDALLAHLDATSTVTVVTTRRDGSAVATPIWAVVVGDAAYVRAAYGDKTAWFRRAESGRPAAFTLADGARAEQDPMTALDDPRVAVTFERVGADDPVQDAVSAAYEAKYAADFPEHVPPVVSAESLAHTLVVRPA